MCKETATSSNDCEEERGEKGTACALSLEGCEARLIEEEGLRKSATPGKAVDDVVCGVMCEAAAEEEGLRKSATPDEAVYEDGKLAGEEVLRKSATPGEVVDEDGCEAKVTEEEVLRKSATPGKAVDKDGGSASAAENAGVASTSHGGTNEGASTGGAAGAGQKPLADLCNARRPCTVLSSTGVMKRTESGSAGCSSWYFQARSHMS